MASREDTRLYKAALDELEALTGEPVVSGEVAEWTGLVTRRIDEFQDLRAAAIEAHESAFAAILETSPEMGGRVEALRDGDDRATGELARIASDLAGALEACRARRSSEEPFERVGDLRSALLGWIARARAHEKEVDHWLVEASLRDTGASD